jgi:hypothetical protein
MRKSPGKTWNMARNSKKCEKCKMCTVGHVFLQTKTEKRGK